MLLGPFALIVTELFRPCSLPLIAELLWAIAGAETAGTAGEIEGLPFTGEIELDFHVVAVPAQRRQQPRRERESRSPSRWVATRLPSSR